MASQASAHATEPDFWRDLRDELLAGRQWVDRAVVLCYAAITGLVVVAFTLLAEQASRGFTALTGAGDFGPYLPLLWTPSLTVVVLWWTRRYVPGAMGSGIPQVVRALDDDLPDAQRSWLVSLRLSLHKVGLVSAGLLVWPACRSGERGPRCRWGLASWVMPAVGCRLIPVWMRTT